MKSRSKSHKQARLVLGDGSEYSGWCFGKPRSQAGEVVFYTGMTGYQHFLSDPSFRGQIVVSSYPLMRNGGYAIRTESLPRDWEVTFTNDNDNSIEGIRSTRYPFSAVQFYPEGCPGPRDTEFLLDKFIEEIKNHKNSQDSK